MTETQVFFSYVGMLIFGIFNVYNSLKFIHELRIDAHLLPKRTLILKSTLAGVLFIFTNAFILLIIVVVPLLFSATVWEMVTMYLIAVGSGTYWAWHITPGEQIPKIEL